ncbi:MAG: ABC transporter ATP-binding protein [Hyphomicrobiaceae bacterium]
MSGNAAGPVLEVTDLRTHFFTKAGVVKAVDGVSLTVGKGEVLGLVGESGSGKSITGFSILGLVDQPGRIVGGSVKFRGEELVGASEERLRDIRGNRIAMIFQDPMMTLNPVLRIDTQMVEAVLAHSDCNKATALKRARDALAMTGIASPEQRLKAYPHELSGGMRQRVAIATAFLNDPDLIIADEPTTALDVTIQAQILAEAQKLVATTGAGLVWITHDLAVVSALADRIAVMYAGRIVEMGRTADVIGNPQHPYTRGLIGSVPSHNQRGQPLNQIPGMTPSLMNLPAGCAFRDRCSVAQSACADTPPVIERSGHMVRCVAPLGGGACA